MKPEANEPFLRWCILGAIGGVLMAAGDWLLGCIPLQATDTGIFDRAYYLSGAYGLWRPVLIVGLGAVGCFLYFFLVKALNADIDAKYRKAKLLQYLCGIFTVAVALAIHLWSATLAWFTTYLGPRIGTEAAIAAVTAYQDDMLIAILPMYLPMVFFIGIHFGMLLAGKTRCPRWMLVFHPVTWNILLAGIPDIAQAMGVPAATWMSVMSQSSTNTAIVIWCIAAAIYGKKHIFEKKGTACMKNSISDVQKQIRVGTHGEDYGSWMSNPVFYVFGGIALVALVLAVLSFSVFKLTALGIVFAVAFVVLLALLGWMAWIRRQYAFGKGGMMEKVHQTILSSLAFDGKGSLLEVGCGSGALSVRAARTWPEAKITGLDYWGAMYNYSQALCEKNAASEGVGTQCTFVHGDANRLDFPDESFDAVISNYPRITRANTVFRG